MTHKPRILIVDDDQQIRLLMSEMLKAFQFDTSAAGGGEEALEIAPGYAPDVILVDIRMPAMSGPELIVRLRMNPLFTQTPIIVLSGEKMTNAQVKAVKADAAIQKPFDLDELLATVRLLMGRSPRKSQSSMPAQA